MHGHLRNGTDWLLQMVLEEKVLVEEKNLQDHQAPEEKEKGETKELEGIKEGICSAKFKCGFRGVLGMT